MDEKIHDDNVAGTFHLHSGEKDVEGKETVIAEHNELFHRTETGAYYVTRNGIELVPTPSSDPNDPLVRQTALSHAWDVV